MIISAVIRKDNELLLIKILAEQGNEVWTLPYFEISDEDNPIELIAPKCQIYNVSIEPVDVFFSGIINGKRTVCFDTQLNSYTNYRCSKNACWVNASGLAGLSFLDEFSLISDKVVAEYQSSNTVKSRVDSIIDHIADVFQLKIEKRTGFSTYSVFVRNDYGGYCPFVFSVEYKINCETNVIDHMISWPITRMFAEGDKTDLYILFSSLMSILLKCINQKDVYLDYLSLFDNAEVNAASIVFISSNKVDNIESLISSIESCFELYVFSLIMFERIVGSFSLVKKDDTQLLEKHKHILEENDGYNSFSREEHQFYGNLENGIYVLHINNGIYKIESLIALHRWQIVEGIDGEILHQIDMDKSSYNFVPHEVWEEILELIRVEEIDKYSIVCQANSLYLLSSDSIWGFRGDFSEYHVKQEKDKIYSRQTYENSVLHFNRTFKWKYPIDAGRFENIVADLIETDPLVETVRLVGKTNNPDGGRDILIFKHQLVDQCAYTTALTVGQCKAYQRTVNKSHVQDIRDMLDYYTAKGFFLAASSTISAPLVDYLCKLRDRYEVDWWTEREIFKKLRQYPAIADSYSDIVEIIEKKI